MAKSTKLQTVADKGEGVLNIAKICGSLNGWSITLMTSITNVNRLVHISWNYSFNYVFSKYLLNSHKLEPTVPNNARSFKGFWTLPFSRAARISNILMGISNRP